MSLASVLFPEYRQQVMALLLLNPGQSYHLREIARRTGAAPGALARELAKLVDAGIISRRQVGNQAHFTADPACPVFEELASIARKTFGLAHIIGRALEPLAARIETAFVFGSIANGTAGPHSDVDLLVIGPVAFPDLVGALHPLQAVLAREINPSLYSAVEWRALVAQDSAFVRDLLGKPKIFVIGDEAMLGKPGDAA